MRYLSLLLFVVLSFSLVKAQSGRPSYTGSGANGAAGSNPNRPSGLDTLNKRAEPDTSYFNYYYLSDNKKKEVYADTSLRNVHQFDPTRQSNVDYLNTGNTGSSAIPITYSPRTQSGFDLGYHQYDLYRIDEDNFKFFDLNRPLNDFYFSPSQGQASFLFKAKFAREFSDGISLHMDYIRINDNGFYTNQATEVTSFASGIAYQSPSKKYQLFINLYNNNVTEEYNGGITTDTLFNQEFFTSLVNIPVYTDQAKIRKAERIFTTNQIYQLKQNDTWDLNLKHKLEIKSHDYLFSDATASTENRQDSILYGLFLTENRGLRSSIDHNSIYNYVGVSLQSQEALALEIGLDYNNINIQHDVMSGSIHSAYLRSKMSTLFRKTIGFKGDLALGLLDYSGDFDLNAQAYVTKGALLLSGGIKLYRYSPSINQEYIEINAIPFWNNDLNKPFGTMVNGQLNIPLTKTQINISQSVENELVYYTADGLVAQSENSVSTTTLALTQGFKLWKLHYQGTVQYQSYSEDLYGLPPLFAKQSLYLETRLFKRLMLVQVGADHRYIKYDKDLRYNPISGAIYPTSIDDTEYQLLDGFLNFKISSVSIFFKQENLLNIIDNRINYLIPGYPDHSSRLRFGLRWFLMD